MSIASVDLRPCIQERLESDLPRLAQEFPGTYVAYGVDGMLFPPAADRWTLFEQCRDAGLKIGDYLIAATIPPSRPVVVDAPEVEISFP